MIRRARTMLAVFAAAGAGLTLPVAAQAAYTGTVNDAGGTLTGDGAGDTLVITGAGGVLHHNLPGFNSDVDFDSSKPGDQTISADSGTLVVDARGGDDVVTAGSGVGAGTHLIVDGGDGNDTLTGGDGGDILGGGAGNDVLDGGGGGNVLNGGPGDDLVRARNSARDLIDCGDGADMAQTDTTDIDAVLGCETLYAAPFTARPGVSSADTTATPAGLAFGAVTVRRGIPSVAITMSCPATEGGGCAGTVVLTSLRSFHVRGITTPVRLGQAAFALGPGQRATLPVRLPRAVRRLADKRRRLGVSARIESRDAVGNLALSTAGGTLRLPR